MKICDKLKNMAPYEPVTKTYPIRLDANESFIEPTREIKERMLEAMCSVKLNRYPDPSCRLLREAAAGVYGVDADNITAGNGSDELISIIISSFLTKGGKILVTVPDFSMYEFYAYNAECEVFKYKKNPDNKINPDEFIELAKNVGADMVIFSNPCNPTGQGLIKSDVLKIINELDCLVVDDEAYMDFWTESILEDSVKSDNCIVLRTCSKACGLASLRAGFAVANKDLIEYINRARSPYNVNSLTQAAVTAVLSDRDYIKNCSENLRRSVRELHSLLSFMNPVPTVTNFVLIETPRAEELHKKLQSRGISIRCLSGKYLRITAGSHDENIKTAKVLRELL